MNQNSASHPSSTPQSSFSSQRPPNFLTETSSHHTISPGREHAIPRALGQATHTNASAFRLIGPLHIDALQQCLNALVGRHEALRTTFVARKDRGGTAEHVIAPVSPLPLQVRDLCCLAEREKEARRLADEEAQRPFDLARGPLLRLALLKLDTQVHLLLITTHQSVVDGCSLHILLRELSVMYTAYLSNGQPELEELLLHSADFALWQRTWLRAEAQPQLLSYWLTQLNGMPPLLQLPTDRPRPRVQTYQCRNLAFSLPAALVAQVRELGRQENASLFETLLAAFETLLYRYTGQPDLVIGSPVANHELPNLIGSFANMVVLRTHVEKLVSFRELLRHVRDMVLEAHAHKELPFAELVRELAPEQNGSYHPLFQVAFVLQEDPLSSFHLPGVQISRWLTETSASSFDLSFILEETAGELSGRFVYSTALFDESSVRRMGEHLRILLEHLPLDPDCALVDLPLLSEGERDYLLVEANRTRTDFPLHATIHDIFAAQAARTPDAIAVAWQDQHLTYRQLNERAHSLAQRLCCVGVGLETRVGVYLDRSPTLLIALLGILKAGGVYVPLDAAQPTERLAFILQDAEIFVLVTVESHRRYLEGLSLPCSLFCQDREDEHEEQCREAPVPVVAENLAYIMYTSGSTGLPKGVGISHRNVVHLVKENTYARLHANQVLLHLAPLAFDASTFEIWGALLHGGRLVLFPAQTPSLEEIRHILEQCAITTLWLTAGLFHQMVETHLTSLQGLEHLLAGGDIVSPVAFEKVLHGAKGIRLTNGYGPTECTTFSCTFTIDDEARRDELVPTVPIGKPIGNAQLYVLDEKLRPVPLGVPGELYIAGPGLARGYLSQAALTAERFLPNPFNALSGARMYKTGDRVRYRNDGNLEFLGRTDRQVKVRGFRIEPGEIEAILARSAGVRDVAVIVRDDGGPQGKHLLAYLVPADAPSLPSTAELRMYAQQKLPAYMVPTAFIWLETLPLTRNGKLNVQALPVPRQREIEGENQHIEPRDTLERDLADIWAEIFRLEHLGVEEDFFELGGHSLMATRVLSRIQKKIHVRLPMRCLFECPTVAGLALAIRRLQDERVVPCSDVDNLAARPGPQQTPQLSAPALHPQARPDWLPLSFAQQRLWFQEQFAPDQPIYHLPILLQLRGPLDVPALRASLGYVLRRHETLRTSFPQRHGHPSQQIAPTREPSLVLLDLSGLAPAREPQEYERLLREELQRLFDLERGPLLRSVVLRRSAQVHVLVLLLHHSISDGWSEHLLVQELSQGYAALRTGTPPQWPALEVQYADYTLWQRDWLQGPRLTSLQEYWCAHLAGAPAQLMLPTDRPRPAMQSYRGAVLEFALAPAIVRRARELGRQEGLTLFMVLLSAFAIVMQRYSGQEDLVIGTPTAGRSRPELEQLIGLFVNLVPLRLRVQAQMGIKDLLARVREVCLGAYEHQDLPFERLVEDLHPERDMRVHPLFQVLFVLQNAPELQETFYDLEVETCSVPWNTSDFDFTVEFWEREGGLRGRVEYSTDLFEEERMQRLIGHYRTVVAGMVEQPAGSIGQLVLVTQAEQTVLLEHWNPLHPPAAPVGCLTDLFAQQVQRSPDALALVADEQQLSYQGLDARANQLAHLLQQHGVRPEQRVGICLERSLELVIAVLAVLKAGGAYVPLDPDYPSERLAFMLQDSHVHLLLTRCSLVDRFPLLTQETSTAESFSILSLDTYAHRICRQPASMPESGVQPANLAYSIYTSGSTGRAKGVMVTHASLVHAYHAWEHAYDLRTRTSCHLQMASFSFDVYAGDLVRGLCSGARLVLCPRETLLEPGQLYQLMRKEYVDAAEFVPAVLRELITYLQTTRRSLDFLRLLVVGSDSWHGRELRRTLELCGAETRVINSYGVTEATVDSSYFDPMVSHIPADDAPVPIGHPLAHMQLYVLDPSHHLLPVGVAGELYIGGPGVARGYLDRPDLTADRFIPHPWSVVPGERIYRTGDRACFLPDGSIELVGRQDQQVKLRGYRVELGEIEARLKQVAGIKQAVVLVRDVMAGEPALVAYLQRDQDGEPVSEPHVRHWLMRHLPAYMVLAHVVWLEHFPLTPNGKLDRRSLPAPHLSTRQDLLAPRTPIEELLANVWAHLLARPQVGITENFFELGGHSLLAMRLLARIQALFQCSLSVRTLFEAPTVELFAARLHPQQTPQLSAPVVRPQARPDWLPLSFAQQRLWFQEQFAPDQPIYHLPILLQLRGPLDVPALRASLGYILRRHDILRTSFPQRHGHPSQQIAPPREPSLVLLDLSGLAPARDPQEYQRLLREELQQLFDLERGPLLRSVVLRRSAQVHVLVLVLHHSISDGWSEHLLVQELSQGYAALRTGTIPQWPALEVQYADYTLWQRDWLQGPRLASLQEYWRAHLAGAPAQLTLPTDRPRPAMQSYRGAVLEFALAPAIVRRARELGRQEGVTLFMVLLSAFAIVMQRYSGQEDLVIGTSTADRGRPELEQLIGLFVNLVPLRLRVQAQMGIKDLLARVREVCLGAYEHQDLPFERLVEDLHPERDMRAHPLFQVLFVLQNTPASTLHFVELDTAYEDIYTRTTQFDLTFDLQEAGEGLRGRVEYSTDLFEEERMQRLIGHYHTVVAGMVEQPAGSIGQLALVTRAEQIVLLEHWNPLHPPATPACCLTDLFAQQVQRSPDALALVAGEQQLSYQELDARANQLAHALVRQGVGTDRCVAICLEPSLELIIAVLAVLKAGGAYVPLDPHAPAERVTFVLADSQSSLLLTQQSLRGLFPGCTLPLLSLDHGCSSVAHYPRTPPEVTCMPDQLAYIIYTSGSTGQPKGVMVSHANGCRLFHTSCTRFRFHDQDVWTLFHSSAFDFSVWEIWGALLYGGRLVIVPYLLSRTPEAFLALLAQQQVTVLNQTPSAFHQLMNAETERATDVALALRLVIFGGEALDIQSLRPWFQRHGDQHPQLVNMYGITETTVHVTWQFLREQMLDETRGSLIGHPLPDLQVYVLDETRQFVPAGVQGEMYVGGAGLSRGYLHRPELTAERFIPHPFSASPGARLYKTGDVARYLPDGSLEYVGRNDQQVKIRGFRIELGEIETIVVQHPAVREGVVIAYQGEGEEKRLVAYLVPTSHALPVEELRRYVHQYLPDYMIPSTFVWVHALPLTINGKVHYDALPIPEVARPELETAYIAPRHEREQRLADIWIHVLGREQVGIDDNFFALGGDSLKSVQVLALARKQGFHYSLQQQFQFQTIRELTRALSADQQEIVEGAGSPAEPFALIHPSDLQKLPEHVVDAYPATRLQVGMLFHHALHRDSAVYQNVISFHLRARFSQQAFHDALLLLIARHPMLRTSFELHSFCDPLQLVHRPEDAGVPLTVGDIRDLAEDEQEQFLRSFWQEEQHRSFDWHQAPLFRCTVHLRSDETFQLTCSEHHAILDGWSVASLITELFHVYTALCAGQRVAARPLCSSFRDFVVLERAAIADHRCRDYWTEKVQGSVALQLPRWQEAEPGAIPRTTRVVSERVAPELTEKIRRVARLAAVPLKSVLLAAHLYVLHYLSGQTDSVTGLVCNGRPELIDQEQILGLFLNTVPLRVLLAGGSWITLAQEVFQAEQELLPFRRYPLAEIQRLAGGTPLFDVLFNFVHFHIYDQLHAFPGLQVIEKQEFARTNVALVVHVEVTSSLEVILECNDTGIADEHLQGIKDAYLDVLSALADDPYQLYQYSAPWTSRERPLLQEKQRDEGWQCGIAELVEEQMQRTPDAIALAGPDQQLSYRTLLARVTHLAAHLVQCGVGPEVRVGVCLPRTSNLLIALLAILKAGGAYVPLDPHYPAARLAFLLHDAQVALLLTEESLRATLPATTVPLLCLETLPAASTPPASLLSRRALPEALAYVIYTSGSTGQPKGVGIAQRNAVAFLHWACTTFSCAELSQTLASTSVCFDLSVFELFAPLCVGGRVVLVPTLVHWQPEGSESGVSLLNTVPSVLRAVLSHGSLPPGLHTVNLAGEALGSSLVQQVSTHRQVRRVCNLYGPSETTTYSTWQEVFPHEERPGIGWPIHQTQAYVLDAWLQPAAAGAIGELYLAGQGVARGYLGRPALTAERFVPDPWSQELGGRLYRTGDLVRLRRDGSLEYVGRQDQQVKVRGYRIEPGEIEARLEQVPGITQALVLVREVVAGEPALVAYLQRNPHGELVSEQQVRACLQEQLPVYMVPAYIVWLEHVPLTPNGKLDRRALPLPQAPQRIRSETRVLPATALEHAIASIWQEVLGIEHPGIHENLFDLGAHSLLMIRTHLKLQERLRRDISLVDLFTYPTIHELACYLDDQQPGAASLRSGIDRAGRRRASMQRRVRAQEKS